MSSKNHPDGVTKVTYQEVETQYGTTMLTYTSTALVSLLLSFGSVSFVKIANRAAQFQPATTFQTVEVSSAESSQSLPHRGSGRNDYRMMG